MVCWDRGRGGMGDSQSRPFGHLSFMCLQSNTRKNSDTDNGLVTHNGTRVEQTTPRRLLLPAGSLSVAESRVRCKGLKTLGFFDRHLNMRMNF